MCSVVYLVEASVSGGKALIIAVRTMNGEALCPAHTLQVGESAQWHLEYSQKQSVSQSVSPSVAVVIVQ